MVVSALRGLLEGSEVVLAGGVIEGVGVCVDFGELGG